jgi:hypothetical protein
MIAASLVRKQEKKDEMMNGLNGLAFNPELGHKVGIDTLQIRSGLPE